MTAINTNTISSRAVRAKSGKNERQLDDESHLHIPARAPVNHVPESESLFTLIRSAIAAFKKGVVWDRGSILNIIA